ncbi:hypothetical protein GCM10027436_50350 [Actinophytocola sediminis]
MVALAVSGALMVAIVYLGMRFVPHYELVAVPAVEHTGGPLPATSPPTASARSGAVVLRSQQDIWRMTLLTSIVGMLVVIAVGLVVGRVVIRRLLAPLRAVNRAAAIAGTGDLAHRINATGPADELKDLADTFDAMLTELQRLLAAHQRFAANASHELLTPLATTRSILQVLTDESSPAEIAELAPMLVETNERNIAIVTALLQLAAAEHTRPDTEPVDLAALVGPAAAERQPVARAKEVHLHVEHQQECWVAGNAPLLRQLVLNLLDNALTYNVPSGRVDVVVARDAAAVAMEIRNTGPLVEPDTTDRLFEPFYRARESRLNSDRSGHGLGLAIVRSVVRAHRGTVTARGNLDGGLTVRVELPHHDGQVTHPAHVT